MLVISEFISKLKENLKVLKYKLFLSFSSLLEITLFLPIGGR